MDPQREQYLENLLDVRNNLYLLNSSNSQELNQAHWQLLFNEHADLLGFVLVPGNCGRDDLEMRMNNLRRNVVNLATSVGVLLQPLQPQGFAEALVAQPHQFTSANGRPPQALPMPYQQDSPAGGDIEEHLGEELSYLADVHEDSPVGRQQDRSRQSTPATVIAGRAYETEHGESWTTRSQRKRGAMSSKGGSIGSQLSPIPLELDEASDDPTCRSASRAPGRSQNRSTQLRPVQGPNTTPRQRQSTFENQPPEGNQPRRRSRAEAGGGKGGLVRRTSNSSLRNQASRKTPYSLNPPSFSQASLNVVRKPYPPFPHYNLSAPSFSQGQANPTQQAYQSYQPTAPALPQAPQNSMQRSQQRQASITLLTAGEAHLSKPIEWPQEMPREQFTRHWDGVLNNIVGGLAMRGENQAGAARRLALYNHQYRRELASAMAPPAAPTAFQMNQNMGTSRPGSRSENGFGFGALLSPSPYLRDEDGVLSGPPAPAPSGPHDHPIYTAASPCPAVSLPSDPFDYTIYDEPSPSPPKLPPSARLDSNIHNSLSPGPRALLPCEPFDASIYDASPPANAVVSSPVRGGDFPPPSQSARPGPPLTTADRVAASYYPTATPDWRQSGRQQQVLQQQQQQQENAADAVVAAAIAAGRPAASPSSTITGNWGATVFECDRDGHTEPN